MSKGGRGEGREKCFGTLQENARDVADDVGVVLRIAASRLLPVDDDDDDDDDSLSRPSNRRCYTPWLFYCEICGVASPCNKTY